MPSSTLVSTACEPVHATEAALAETCAHILREKIPNFFRLYLNPYVAQTCYCLAEYVSTTWPAARKERFAYPTFLANSFDEALSGGIKLVRYCANLENRPAAGLIFDPAARLGAFVSVTMGNTERIEFVPQLTVVANTVELSAALMTGARYGFVVLLAAPGPNLAAWADLYSLMLEQEALIIVGVDRAVLAEWRLDTQGGTRFLPDIVVFDESFADHAVPFAGFTARAALYRHWTRRGKSSFHSTTFQPNAISSLHFLRCLKQADPVFHASVASVLQKIEEDPAFCRALLGTLYSPFLARVIRMLGFNDPFVRAEGHYIRTGGVSIFDCVAGVACSVRGHSPETYVTEVAGRTATDLHVELAGRLEALTGLGCLMPAVSGAGAVENALRVALVAQFPRRVVVAFEGGFGGKTLFALTGTARATYKQHLDPLYRDVVYVDPFAPNVLDELQRVLDRHSVALVQLELVQAVGGVRALPSAVLQFLESNRERHGYLILVDEVQTGMFRTGPITLSSQLEVRPDLLTIGKGTSDMMFPFALTLYSQEVQERLTLAQPSLAGAIRERFGYDWGYRTVLNVLDHAEKTNLPRQVQECGKLFAELLTEGLAGCKRVRELRVYGMLVAIELETRDWPARWFPRGISWLYLISLLRHANPLLVGFCQYEPHVLKVTPPLSITPDEVRRVCGTLLSVLRAPHYRLLAKAAGSLMKSYIPFRGQEKAIS